MSVSNNYCHTKFCVSYHAISTSNKANITIRSKCSLTQVYEQITKFMEFEIKMAGAYAACANLLRTV
jgi:hypothetical protein